MNIKTVSIDTLEYDPFNVREHDERNVDAIKASIARFGQQKPIVVKRDGTVIAGNGTLGAMRILGYKEIVIAETDLDGEEAVAFAIADNRTAELATWDDQALAQALDQLDDELLPASGFDEDEMAELLERLEPSDIDSDAPEAQTNRADELQEKWVVKPGDLWVIGDHRLICGDATSEEDFDRLMGGEEVGSVVTDPPYGVSAVSKSGVLKDRYAEDIIGDESTEAAMASFLMCSSMDVPQIWWGANYYCNVTGPGECWLVWDKNNGGSDQADAELAWTNIRGAVRMFTQASEKVNRAHPTQKHPSLMIWCLEKVGPALVFDPFLGSGTTMVAAEQLNRRCFGMELEPKYCAVILERMTDMGLDPRLDGSRDC